MWLSLGVFIAINFAAALSGAIFSPDAWYRALNKPSWQPPDWLFPPAWAVLYLLIAFATWRVWITSEWHQLFVPMAAFGVQVVLNAAWSALFFGMRRIRWALIEVAALWASIVAMIVTYAPLDTIAALMLLPYLAWVSFAAFLNFTILRLNPDEGRAAVAA
jgi:tryptophan-rich sensory protein